MTTILNDRKITFNEILAILRKEKVCYVLCNEFVQYTMNNFQLVSIGPILSRLRLVTRGWIDSINWVGVLGVVSSYASIGNNSILNPREPVHSNSQNNAQLAKGNAMFHHSQYVRCLIARHCQ